MKGAGLVSSMHIECGADDVVGFFLFFPVKKIVCGRTADVPLTSCGFCCFAPNVELQSACEVWKVVGVAGRWWVGGGGFNGRLALQGSNGSNSTSTVEPREQVLFF